MASPRRPIRALVTGGGGFIGSHLCGLLLDRGDVVTVIDDFSTGRRGNLDAVSSVDARRARLRVLEGDVVARLAETRPTDFDVVYHLAAAVGVRLVVEQPIRTIETNVELTGVVLRFAAAGGLPTLVASTSEVYGRGVRVPMHEDDDVIYGPTSRSRWCYAYSKAIDEHLALAYHRERALPAVVARFFNTVGPRQVGEYGMVLPRFVRNALLGVDLEVHGDGKQSRCFCDVRDVVAALPTLLETRACHGRVFNLGHDEPISIRALAELVVETLGSSSRIRHLAYEEAFKPGFDDLEVRRPDLGRIREAIGFAPRIPLKQTIRDLAAEIAPTIDGGVARGATACS